MAPDPKFQQPPGSKGAPSFSGLDRDGELGLRCQDSAHRPEPGSSYVTGGNWSSLGKLRSGCLAELRRREIGSSTPSPEGGPLVDISSQKAKDPDTGSCLQRPARGGKMPQSWACVTSWLVPYLPTR